MIGMGNYCSIDHVNKWVHNILFYIDNSSINTSTILAMNLLQASWTSGFGSFLQLVRTYSKIISHRFCGKQTWFI